MSSDREVLKREFLRGAGFGDARRELLAGDASTRCYERLYSPGGAQAIFMDQPPGEGAPCPPRASPDERRAAGYNAMARLAAGRVDAFVAVAGWLREQGLSAPRILAHDASAGLAVIEDLGDGVYARLIEDGADEAELYDAAIAALAQMHAAAPPPVLTAPGASWPLLEYDEVALKVASDLFVEWLPKLRPNLTFGPDAITKWDALWAPVQARAAQGASVFCHRDYHAENMIWMPERTGAARVGLLDFQDAVRAHPAWDMSMLLHDARRDVSAEREAACLERYFELRPQVDRAAFTADFHALGALNIVRILGIFSRLVTRDGKPRYAGFMPRLWGYLDRCLADAQLAPLASWLEAYAPADLRQ